MKTTQRQVFQEICIQDVCELSKKNLQAFDSAHSYIYWPADDTFKWMICFSRFAQISADLLKWVGSLSVWSTYLNPFAYSQLGFSPVSEVEMQK